MSKKYKISANSSFAFFALKKLNNEKSAISMME